MSGLPAQHRAGSESVNQRLTAMDARIAPQHPVQADRFFSARKLAALTATLQDDGVPIEPLLAGSGLSPPDLQASDARVSTQQLALVLERIAESPHRDDLPWRAAERLSVAHLGLFGYALLSSASVRSALQFSITWGRIVGSLARIRFNQTDEHATFTVEPLLSGDPRRPLYRLIVEYEFAILHTLLRDAIGAAFQPQSLELRTPAPSNAVAFPGFFGCPVQFDAATNAYRFGREWLERPLPLSEPAPNAILEHLCTEELSELTATGGLVADIRRILISHPGQPPSIDAIASDLRLHPRTLRRRLQGAGTSYKGIVAGVRKHLALGYLKQTRMTNEEIAERLGYSDTANFRHAFKRWTAGLPGDYRNR